MPQQTTPTLPEQKPIPWFAKHVLEIIIGVIVILVGAWATYFYGPQGRGIPTNKGVANEPRVRGMEGVTIADLKAGRNINIDVSQPGPQSAKSPVEIAPVIRVTPIRFIIYKPSEPQVPGQEKAWIQVRVSNDSSLHPAHQVHVRFLTDDGLIPKHRADSDEWNTKMGTPSLYTFDLPPRGVQEAMWRPDIPGDSQALYGAGRARFTLAIHISWEDLEHKKYELLDMFELAYNRELKDFVLEKKANYNSFFDGDKIRGALGEWSKLKE